MVCSPAAVVTFVSTGVFSFTLVQTSVTVGCGGLGNCGGLGICGNGGSFTPLGNCGSFGICGICGAFGACGVCGGGGGENVNRLPSTSCPSIMLLPRSCTCSGGSFGAPGICGIPGADGADVGGIGMTMASFFKWSSMIVF